MLIRRQCRIRDIAYFSHMPFLSNAGGQLLLVYARAKQPENLPVSGSAQLPWKLWYSPLDGTAERIPTGLPPEVIECSPSVSVCEGTVYLSFNATSVRRDGTQLNRLMLMQGPSLDQLGKAEPVIKRDAYCGFWRPGLKAAGCGEDGLVHLQGQANGVLRTNFETVSRASFCFDSPARLLISGRIPQRRPIGRPTETGRTILYDLDQRRLLGEIRIAGEAAYKATLCAGLVAYSASNPSAGAGYQVRFNSDFAVMPTDITAAFEASAPVHAERELVPA